MDDSNKSSPMDNLKSVNTESAKCEGFQMPSGNGKAPSGMFNEVAAVLKFQKLYRGHRIRRMLADSAVVAQELWWQAIYHVKLNHSTISFFESSKPESAASRWNRIRSHASKVGKGLCKDTEAEKLFFEHWIEAIDPRHRYGGSLYLYYKEWSKTDSGQPFFYWLDVGDGKMLDLKECPRSKLQQQCIKYLGPIVDMHYRPTIDRFQSFVSFLKNNGVNLDEVQVDHHHLRAFETEDERYKNKRI